MSKEEQALEDDFSIFNQTEDQIANESDSFEKNPDFYSPSLRDKNVKNGIYTSRIRFLPDIINKGKNRIMKYIYYLPDPNDPDKNFYVDCPSNFGGPKAKSNIITQAFFECKGSNNAVLRDLKRTFTRKTYWWSLAQIMIDEQDPEQVGKIKIFRFGKQVNQKIQTLLDGNEKLKKSGINVFDLLKGKDFMLYIAEGYDDNGRKMTTYQQSYFDDEITPISLDGGDTRINPKDQSDQKRVIEYLKSNTPDISQIYPKEWDQQLEEKIIESVKTTIADDMVFNRIYKKSMSSGGIHVIGGTNHTKNDGNKKSEPSKHKMDEETKSGGEETIYEETKPDAEETKSQNDDPDNFETSDFDDDFDDIDKELSK
jgi:hypothetical protein